MAAVMTKWKFKQGGGNLLGKGVRKVKKTLRGGEKNYTASGSDISNYGEKI